MKKKTGKVWTDAHEICGKPTEKTPMECKIEELEKMVAHNYIYQMQSSGIIRKGE